MLCYIAYFFKIQIKINLVSLIRNFNDTLNEQNKNILFKSYV
jgi:hypothetical protein